MRARYAAVMLVAFALAIGCEDGPEQIFTPNEGNPSEQNGNQSPTWVQEGETSFEDEGGSGDRIGRAQFCDEAEHQRLVQWMVQQPIIPDTSAGGFPLWDNDGNPVNADDLLGRPADFSNPDKFCEPDYVYLDAYVWGSLYEVVVIFNQDTHLVEEVWAGYYGGYFGTLDGSYTTDGGTDVEVVLESKQKIKVDGKELDDYLAWIEPANVNAVYNMIQETFFGVDKPDSFDCFAAKVCEVVSSGTGDNISTTIVFFDSGISLPIEPDGTIQIIMLEQVRMAPFEFDPSLDMSANAGVTGVSPGFSTSAMPSCSFDLGEGGQLTFAEFKNRCAPAGNTSPSLKRAYYNVGSQRDAVYVEFNNVNFGFKRDFSQSGKEVYGDGEWPADDDQLFYLQFFFSLQAPVEEYVPSVIGPDYAQRLQQRLADIVPAGHPFKTYQIEVPATLPATPQPVGKLVYLGDADGDGTSDDELSFVEVAMADVLDFYNALTPAEQAQVDPRIHDPIFLIEPFMDAVLSAFSHGQTDAPDAFKAFRTTDTNYWSIAFGHFVQDGVPYRLELQYSRYYGMITAVAIERDNNNFDDIYDALTTIANDNGVGQGLPFYHLELAKALPEVSIGGKPVNQYSLGGMGINVRDFDRKLETLKVTLTRPETLADSTRYLSVDAPGSHIIDGSGYDKQVGGERYEFVPAHEVQLNGRGTYLTYHIREDGTIGRIASPTFKGTVELCNDLHIAYGDDVPLILETWAMAHEPDVFKACDIVYNYSANGQVLESVVSLRNKVRISTVADRAVTATIWD